MSMQALFNIFGDRIMNSRIRPARSPDLSPYDFFFWGCLKDKAYNITTRTEEELKENIRRKIAIIPSEQLQRVYQNPFRRCKECLRVEGQLFENQL
jgi:hypothetical protein